MCKAKCQCMRVVCVCVRERNTTKMTTVTNSLH